MTTPFQDKRRDKIRMKPTSWSHQHELTAAIGKTVVVHYASSDDYYVEGVLVAADQFTLKIKRSLANDDVRYVVVFKSALATFEVKE